MGAVYLGRREDGTAVAVKKQHAHLVEDPAAVASFFDEARLAARIQHPNVVSVVDVTMNDGALVLVMEYVEGASLAALQRHLPNRTGRSFHWREAVRIVADALRGLHAAHELRDRKGQLLNVVHRDVSPQNLLVGIDGVTRVTDFGVARAAGRLKSTKTDTGIAGKLQYLSPEQVSRDPVDRRADLFAAGIVLWECLAGISLFQAQTEAETIVRILRGTIEPPSMHANDVPLEVDEICLRALERDPARRYGTAAEFADALESAGAASHPEIARVVLECTRDEVTRRQTLLSGPLTNGANVLDLTEPRPAPVASKPGPRAFGRPALLVASLAGVLAGGLAVSVLARPTLPAPLSITPPKASDFEAPPARPAAKIENDALPTAASSLPPVTVAPPPPSSPRPATQKPRPGRRDAGVAEFVPKEM
jgi:serine/threonine-protein kinase